MTLSLLYPDSVGKVRKIFRFLAAFHDSATDCTTVTLMAATVANLTLVARKTGQMRSRKGRSISLSSPFAIFRIICTSASFLLNFVPPKPAFRLHF
jgi:hypothetical protein